MALRTDAKVIDFIDCEAVKKAYSNNTLTLDQVLLEIEKDERYDQSQGKLGKNEINHKEFVTWREACSPHTRYVLGLSQIPPTVSSPSLSTLVSFNGSTSYY